MGIITKIQVQKNNENRVNVYLDDKFFCGISVDLTIKHKLKVGSEIDDNYLQELVVDDEKISAFDKAVNYLGRGLKSVKQMQEYLGKKGYSQFTCEHVINKLLEYKYLNDEEYARAFVLTYSKKFGILKLKNQLRQKGIDEFIVEDVFCSLEDNISSIECVANKYIKNKEINRETVNKLYRFLATRGYEYDEIGKVVKKIEEQAKL